MGKGEIFARGGSQEYKKLVFLAKEEVFKRNGLSSKMEGQISEGRSKTEWGFQTQHCPACKGRPKREESGSGPTRTAGEIRKKDRTIRKAAGHLG